MNPRPEYEWRCHLFYLTSTGEKEVVYNVTASDEDAALRIAHRMLRNHKSRANLRVVYSEAVTV